MKDKLGKRFSRWFSKRYQHSESLDWLKVEDKMIFTGKAECLDAILKEKLQMGKVKKRG